MEKYCCMFLCLISLTTCSQEKGTIEKIVEEGIEVVLNHQEPYEISNMPSSLTLQKLFSIDTEDDSMAEKGITDIYLFDADESGNIFIMRPPTSKGDLVYIFSREGSLKSSFGEFGQGPFELEYPSEIIVTSENEVWILESPKKKYFVFDKNGNGIYEKRLDFDFDTITPLGNGNYLLKQIDVGNDPEAKYFSIVLRIIDPEFNKLQDLDSFNRRPNRRMATKLQEKIVNGIEYIILGQVHKGCIFTCNCDRGYEILKYNTEGNLLQKIRKEYNPVPVSQKYKTEYLKMYEEFMPEYAQKIYFSDNWHPFHSFFLDGTGRIFVMTYEPGNNNKEFIYDIFNEDGVFFHRTSLNILHESFGRLYAKATGGRLYCLQEKDSGFKELVVYKMMWE